MLYDLMYFTCTDYLIKIHLKQETKLCAAVCNNHKSLIIIPPQYFFENWFRAFVIESFISY